MYIDVTERSYKTIPLDEGFIKKWLGATGIGIKLLMDYQEPRIDPFHPCNPLVFTVGPFVGTMVPCSSRYGVFAKSPLSNLLGEAYSAGFWCLEFKRAGYDALVVKGKADRPLYLYIEDDTVHFLDASHLWGKTTWETEDTIRRELGDHEVRVASIGPAGENLVRFACIMNDRYRAAGRTGLGAVMGSKNIKAIAVRGTGAVEVAEPKTLQEKCLELYHRLQGPATTKYRTLGTSANILVLNTAAALPTRNYREAMFDGALQVSGETLNEMFVAKIQACPSCPMRCEHVAEVKDGKFKGTTVRVEYESLWALGPYCGVRELDAVIKAIELCDLYGMDAISTGVVIGFVMECFSRGLISREDTGGVALEFGNSEALLTMIEQIAFRENLGSILAEGVKRASEKISGSIDFAMHVKGVEMTGYDVRGLKTAALGYAVSRRGAHHQTHGAYSFDLSGKVDRFKAERGRGKLVAESEDIYIVYDSLPLCKFTRAAWKGLEEIAYIYNLVTGFQFSAADLLKSAERISNLARIYNMREGLTWMDDTLPPRVMKDPIPEGLAKGSKVAPEELRMLILDYYEARGWDSEGVPRPSKLLELGIEEYIPLISYIAR
ncbi:aldehyde ferredoxin oxidoreductase family protein [Candidatus Bathyarchaeota archaeon]|nr:aldehyde ferredoxin oxidoreductase family protein [Candidatus Bathyarchaeota archaeon]